MLNDTIFIGDVKVLPSRRLIVKSDSEELVDPLVMKLLLALAERKGDVVRREDLIDEVWGEAYASDTHLSRVVWGLRRALGDSAENPTYIETVPRVGYRLIPEVRVDADPSVHADEREEGAHLPVLDTSSVEPVKNSIQSHMLENMELRLKLRWMQRAVAVLAVAVIGMALLLWKNQPTLQEHNIEVIRVSDEDGVVDSLRYEGSVPFAESVLPGVD